MIRRGAGISVALLATAAAVVALSCGGDAPPVRTSLTPIVTVDVPGALELATVGSAAAIATARQDVMGAADRLGAVEMPANPVARLTSAGAFLSWAKDRRGIVSRDSDQAANAVVWAVQLEGQWRPPPGSISTGPERFALVAIDAKSGEVIAGALSPEPFFAPHRLRAKTTFSCVVFEPAEARVTLGPHEAIRALEATYPPGTAGKSGSLWELARADAQVVRCVDTSGGTDTFRFRWFVTVPSEMELHDCSTPSSRAADLKRRCWSPVAIHLVDGVTGEEKGRQEVEFTGPLLTDQEFADVRSFATSAGWWEAWARLSAYDNAIVPASVLGGLAAR